MKESKPAPKRGPKPETLALDGPWEDAMKEALAKGKPPAPAKQSKTHTQNPGKRKTLTGRAAGKKKRR